MLSAPSRAPAWPSARLIAPCSALPSPGNAGARLDRWPARRAPEHSRAFQKLPIWHWNTSMQQAPIASSSCPVGCFKYDDENEIVPISSEQIGARLRELHISAAVVHPQPTALDRQLQAGAVFGRRCVLPKQKWRVDLLDMDPAVLHSLRGVGDLQELTGCLFGSE